MINSRKQFSGRYSNAAMLARQRQQLYKSQKQAGMFDKRQPFKLMPVQFDTDSIWFWFFMLNMLGAGFAAAVPSRNERQEAASDIASLAHKRLIPESSISGAELQAGFCLEVARRVGALAESNSAFRERAQAVLSRDDFKLVCGNKKFLERHQPTAVAFFQAGMNAVFIAYDHIKDVGIAHEFIHAYQHYLHLPDGHCHIPYNKASLRTLVPFFPVNQMNLEKFEEYMDAGDQRIRRLYRLSQKHLNDEHLTSDEIYQLLRAKTELADTIIATKTLTLPLSKLDQLKRLGWPKMKDLTITLDEQRLHILDVVVKHDAIKVSCQSIGAIDTLYGSISQFERLRVRGKFNGKSAETGERLAYSLQCLSRKGSFFIYPELTEFLESQKNLCRPAKPRSINKSEL